MPSRPQANPNHISVVDLLDRAVVWAGGHPGTTFLVLLAVTVALYAAGVLSPLDWWGQGQEVGR